MQALGGDALVDVGIVFVHEDVFVFGTAAQKAALGGGAHVVKFAVQGKIVPAWAADDDPFAVNDGMQAEAVERMAEHELEVFVSVEAEVLVFAALFASGCAVELVVAGNFEDLCGDALRKIVIEIERPEGAGGGVAAENDGVEGFVFADAGEFGEKIVVGVVVHMQVANETNFHVLISLALG